MENLDKLQISNLLEKNGEIIRGLFKDDASLIIREIENKYDLFKCFVVFIDGIVDPKIIVDSIISPLINSTFLLEDSEIIDVLSTKILSAPSAKNTSLFSEVINGILNGDTVLFLDNNTEAIILSTKKWETRTIEEPASEKVLRGPKEGFTESLITNISLIRRRISTSDLKFHQIKVGDRTNTSVCICYIEGIAIDHIKNQIIEEIKKINIDGVLDTNYIREFLDPHTFSLFDTIGMTEKADIVAGRLLEGRIAVLCEGSPTAMTAPALFAEFLMTADDYYLNYTYASIGRLLRFVGFFSTISIPALYLALVTYHQGLIPSPLLMSIYASRQGVPFPSVLELTILLISFEGLREAGARVPSSIGQATSIVGALVLGTAAVEARFVSAPIIIIVGVTATTALLTPNLIGAAIILRLFLLFLSATLGLYGYIYGILVILIHIFSLRSFGLEFTSQLSSFKPQNFKDTYIRAPWWFMRYRPNFMSENKRRISKRG